MKSRHILLFLIGSLLLVSLACQTGEVLTPAEATARAVEARSVKLKAIGTPSFGDSKTNEEKQGPQPGDTVELVGKGFMISLYQEAGATRIIAQQERGTQVVYKDKQEVNGETWYFIDAPTGLGWVKAENVKVPETTTPKPQPGDTVYLKGKSYMISLFQEAGGTRILAQQERNTAVTIKDMTEIDGKSWYLIDAPTGLGWVTEDNITTEAP